MLFSKLMPKEGNFFELFNRHAEHVVEAAQAFGRLVEHYGDAAMRQQHTREVDGAERAADRVTHEVTRLVHTTFITPIDREQIHALINQMDDVADSMTLYDVQHMTPEVAQLTALCMQCCERVRDAVALLPRVAEQAAADAALKFCEEIDRLESEGDRLLREAMSKLFRQEPDVRELIKLKALYELLETVTDKCEDVANQIEGVILENS